MTKRYTTKRYDKDVYNILENGTVVANAIAYSNGTWRAHDLDDKVIAAHGAHISPKDLVKAMNAAV